MLMESLESCDGKICRSHLSRFPHHLPFAGPVAMESDQQRSGLDFRKMEIVIELDLRLKTSFNICAFVDDTHIRWC